MAATPPAFLDFSSVLTRRLSLGGIGSNSKTSKCNEEADKLLAEENVDANQLLRLFKGDAIECGRCCQECHGHIQAIVSPFANSCFALSPDKAAGHISTWKRAKTPYHLHVAQWHVFGMSHLQKICKQGFLGIAKCHPVFSKKMDDLIKCIIGE